MIRKTTTVVVVCMVFLGGCASLTPTQKPAQAGNHFLQSSPGVTWEELAVNCSSLTAEQLRQFNGGSSMPGKVVKCPRSDQLSKQGHGARQSKESKQSQQGQWIAQKDIRMDVWETFAFRETDYFAHATTTGNWDDVTVVTIDFPEVLGEELFVTLEDVGEQHYISARKMWEGVVLWPNGKEVFFQASLSDVDRFTQRCALSMDLTIDATFDTLSDARFFLFSTGGSFAVSMNGAHIPIKTGRKKKIDARTLYAQGVPMIIGRNTPRDRALLAQWVNPEYAMFYRQKKDGIRILYPQHIVADSIDDIRGANPEYTFWNRVGSRGGVSVGLSSFDPVAFFGGNIIGNTIAAWRKPKIPFYNADMSFYSDAVAQCKTQTKTQNF